MLTLKPLCLWLDSVIIIVITVNVIVFSEVTVFCDVIVIGDVNAFCGIIAIVDVIVFSDIMRLGDIIQFVDRIVYRFPRNCNRRWLNNELTQTRANDCNLLVLHKQKKLVHFINDPV